jgi:hypothetical protein
LRRHRALPGVARPAAHPAPGLEDVLAIEAITDDRLRDEVGTLQLVAPEDRVTGSGEGYIMAAFTHVPPIGGRFTDGTYGAYDAGPGSRDGYRGDGVPQGALPPRHG